MLDGGLIARIHAVARRALAEPYFFWDWGEAVLTRGLLAAARATGEPEYYRWVTVQIDRWMERSPRPFWPDHVGPGDALLEYYEHARAPHLLAYAHALADHFSRLPVASTGARLNRPDKPDIAHLVWVDSMQSDAAFLARLGQVAGEASYFDLAAEVLHGQVASLQNVESGLFYHCYSDATRATNGVVWARGCGWAAIGLAETARWLPIGHVGRAIAEGSLRRLAAALARWQDATGHWHTVVDHLETRLEHSTTALVAEALSVGLELGALPPALIEVRDRAWQAVAAAVDAEGRVLGVSERTPVATTVEAYDARRPGGVYAWGQGPWLLIASRMALSREHGGAGREA